MKVLFTGCTFDDKKINNLKNIGIEVINGRTDYSEDELAQELINKDDLYEAIMNNKILAVAMDGFYEEPIMKECNDKLLDLPNDKIIITPHNAYNSIDAVDEMERMLIESMIDIANNNVIVRNIVK